MLQGATLKTADFELIGTLVKTKLKYPKTICIWVTWSNSAPENC